MPDGFGYSYSFRQPVRGQAESILLQSYQLGATVPAWQTATDGLFINASVKTLGIQTQAVFTDDRELIPNRFWDVQLGGTYVRQLSSDTSIGISMAFGSASNKPFESIREDTISALAFYRTAQNENDAWLFYLMSMTNGQIGRNIPIPGVAYEFERDVLQGIVGFPFVSLTYKPFDSWKFQLYFAPITDLRATTTYSITDRWSVASGFIWDNQSYFRAERNRRHEFLFLYEKKLESSLQYNVTSRINFNLTGGYAFDRFFVENHGFGLRGRNRTDIGSGPYSGCQLNFNY